MFKTRDLNVLTLRYYKVNIHEFMRSHGVQFVVGNLSVEYLGRKAGQTKYLDDRMTPNSTASYTSITMDVQTHARGLNDVVTKTAFLLLDTWIKSDA